MRGSIARIWTICKTPFASSPWTLEAKMMQEETDIEIPDSIVFFLSLHFRGPIQPLLILGGRERESTLGLAVIEIVLDP